MKSLKYFVGNDRTMRWQIGFSGTPHIKLNIDIFPGILLKARI